MGTVTAVRYKRDQITASIRLYEKQLDQARADLAHINAAIRPSKLPWDMIRSVDTHRMFREGEPETWKERRTRGQNRL
jgi:hypothetical protein